MARKFLNDVATDVGRKVRTANNKRRKLAAQVNRLDKSLGGMVLQNPLSRTVVPYLNAAGTVVDIFDDLMGIDTHPQSLGSQVAGVSNNLSIARTRPKFTNTKGTIRIQHKELIGSVSLTSSGAVSTCNSLFPSGRSAYFVSPTNVSLFPWLSQIAGNYDYFRFRRLRLVYVPTCSTATAGRVMLAYDPDTIDGIPFDRSALSAYCNSVEASAWGVSKLDCALINNLPWFNTDDPANSSLLPTCTQGQVLWAGWSGTATADVGEWYVLYDVELKDPSPSVNEIYAANGNAGSIINSFAQNAPVAWVSDSVTTVKVLFTSVGTYMLTWSAASTASGSVVSGGSITVIGSTLANNGALSVNQAVVRVTGSSFSLSPGVASNPAFIQINGFTGLAAWQVNVVKIAPINTFPIIT